MMGSLMMAKAVQRRTRVRHSDFDRKRRASRIRHRQTYMLISGLIGTALGTAADLSISVLRTLAQPSSSGEFIWLFVWILGVAGVGLGATLGVKVADVYVGMGQADPDQSSGQQFIIRVSVFSFIAIFLIWLILMILG
jgi:hypothetical protein